MHTKYGDFFALNPARGIGLRKIRNLFVCFRKAFLKRVDLIIVLLVLLLPFYACEASGFFNSLNS